MSNEILPLIVIPARYNSTRLPGKPLLMIQGTLMIVRVWQQCKEANVGPVVVATDDEGIKHVIEQAGGNAVMTLASHRNGTERVAEVARESSDGRIIVNVQGDMPFVDPEIIRKLVQAMRDGASAGCEMATPVRSGESLAGWKRPDLVKVVMRKDETALYFSRTPIPYQADVTNPNEPVWFRHVGIYAYRNFALQELVKEQPTWLEIVEQLEQLRALQLGYKIKCVIVEEDSGQEFNTVEDLESLKGG